ncbi:hypothetical protein AB0368_24805 [Actinoplanes sp. NPDC051475]|uniref:hypothetical protein n=1 Tax=Actinoplanes sp. NPDC051475 TaxID=3157225 RepID=UPI00344E9D86
MVIDALRRGWPEQILTGRYAFRTRRRDGFAAMLGSGVELLSDELIEPEKARQLHIRVDDRSVMVVMKDPGRAWSPAPPGPKACGIDPPGPLLTLLPITGMQHSWFEPRTCDVLDNRLGTIIGRLLTTGGFVRPARTVILDPTGRVAGHLAESLFSFVSQWLQIGFGWGLRRFTFRVEGRRVAHIRQVSRLWAREFRVDVSGAGGSLDPRLVLACGVQQFSGLSSY